MNSEATRTCKRWLKRAGRPSSIAIGLFLISHVFWGPKTAFSETLRLILPHPYPYHSLQAAQVKDLREAFQDYGLAIQVATAQQAGVAGPLSEAVRAGIADLAIVPTEELVKYSRNYSVFEISFLFSHYFSPPPSSSSLGVLPGALYAYEPTHVRRSSLPGILQRLWHHLTSATREKGIMSLGLWNFEMMHIAGREPILTPADLRGSRVITRGTELVAEQFKRGFGAHPVRLSATQAYLELSRGEAFALESPLRTIRRMKSVLPYVTITNHRLQATVLIVNQAKWNQIPVEARKGLEGFVAERSKMHFRGARKREQEFKAELKRDPSVTVLDLNWRELKLWEDAVADSTRSIARKVESKLVEVIWAEGRPRVQAAKRLNNRLVWNGWFEGSSGEEAAPLTVNRIYSFKMDLSQYAYRAPYSADATAVHRKQLLDRKVTLLLRPVIIGETVRAAGRDPLGARTLVVDGSRLSENCKEKRKAFRDGTIKIGEFAKAVNLGNIVSWDIQTERTGCGAIAVSVWDESGLNPLDHVVFEFPVTEANADKPSCDPQLVAGLNTILRRPDFQQPADAALNLFETNLGGTEKTIAEFVSRKELEAAANDPTGINAGAYGWVLPELLSKIVSDSGRLPFMIQKAREYVRDGHPNPYEDVAAQLALAIFSVKPGRDPVPAQQALKALRDVVDKIEKPSVLVRFVSKTGRPMFFPLGLLAASAANPVISRHFTVIYPMPSKHVSHSPRCFKHWYLAIPKELEGLKGDIADVLSSLSVGKPDEMTHLSSPKAFLEHMESDKKNSEGEGLVLLAHHDNGAIWFNRFQRPCYYSVHRFKRNFGPGSAALLAACKTSGRSPESGAILEQLNLQGVDAIIMSPFPVDTEFGAQLAIEFEKTLEKKREASPKLTLLELFRCALQNTVSHFERNGLPQIADQALEFQLVGHPGLTFCSE